MAVMADRNVGFKGTVDTADWAMIAGQGARYSVGGATDLRVSPATADRSVTIRPGTAWGDGVLSEFDTSTSLQANSISSGERWDTVVVRRTWQPDSTPTGTAQLMIIAGSSTKTVASSRKTAAGTDESDQPIALIRVRAGLSQVQEVADLRAWHGGALTVADEAAMGYLDDPGATLNLGERQYRRVINAAGNAVWIVDDSTDSGYQNIAYSESGWSMANKYQVRNGWGIIRVDMYRSGSGFTSRDLTLGGVVPTAHRPSANWFGDVVNHPAGTAHVAQLSPSGTLTISAVTGTNGMRLRGQLSWPVG